MSERHLQIGGWIFDHIRYDSDSDVLYLSIGEPRGGYGERTPEGHFLNFDDEGEFYGLTLIGGRGEIEATGETVGTVPSPPRAEQLDKPSLARVLEYA